ncbi:ribosome biogenesis GTP-binding protein YihA/YsxC [Reichenbachiella versicolor]|uniref:ribosome biogenesis GTP-binding protein YihA/YsxC n=1 Tax=Reichenbachiella versicolor TaxID=1821036 RepID=UPI000D6E9097|nr:ribosome biogenesis GTP-binding protein YihA/YsxC [Reichenbachiella versicolor]
MKIKSAEFVISNQDYKKCPKLDEPEYAFIGRSNVGKSSLINMLTNKTSLAKTSGKPGKTQLINHFFINKEWYLVDLPGYGWAQVSKVLKEKWDKMNKDYLLFRENMASMFVLIDSRIPPQKIDLEFIQWAGENGIPFGIIFTKADKPGNSKIQANIAAFRRELKKSWDELPPNFVTSSAQKVGQQEVLNYIQAINESL